MKETKNDGQLAGLTQEAQDGSVSLPNLRDGEESHAMLLALVNSPLATLINNQQAKIIGSGLNISGKRFTMVMFYEAEYKNGLLAEVKS